MLKKIDSETKFPHYVLGDTPGELKYIGETGARLAVCETGGCWAKGEPIEVADDDSDVHCGACGLQIQ